MVPINVGGIIEHSSRTDRLVTVYSATSVYRSLVNGLEMVRIYYPPTNSNLANRNPAVLSYFMGKVLQTIGIDSHVGQANVILINNCQQFCWALFGAAMVDRVGRRPLLLFSNIGMSLHPHAPPKNHTYSAHPRMLCHLARNDHLRGPIPTIDPRSQQSRLYRHQPRRRYRVPSLHLHLRSRLLRRVYATPSPLPRRSPLLRNARQRNGFLRLLRRGRWSPQPIRVARFHAENRLENLHHLHHLVCHPSNDRVVLHPRDAKSDVGGIGWDFQQSESGQDIDCEEEVGPGCVWWGCEYSERVVFFLSSCGTFRFCSIIILDPARIYKTGLLVLHFSFRRETPCYFVPPIHTYIRMSLSIGHHPITFRLCIICWSGYRIYQLHMISLKYLIISISASKHHVNLTPRYILFNYKSHSTNII